MITLTISAGAAGRKGHSCFRDETAQFDERRRFCRMTAIHTATSLLPILI